jgi:predicted nucleic acid-binding protein
MFVLDTNVVSELRKARLGKANAQVAQWADSCAPTSQYISAITVLELEIGVLRLERRDPAQGAFLRDWLSNHVLSMFAGRILAVDSAVAQCSAGLHVPNLRPVRDALIAATAIIHGMTVATRNVADFTPTGVRLLNPWTGEYFNT